MTRRASSLIRTAWTERAKGRRRRCEQTRHIAVVLNVEMAVASGGFRLRLTASMAGL